MKNILIICVGNICRSPVAEALLKAALPDKDFFMQSAGLGALVGHEAHPLMQKKLTLKGIDLSHHRARQITAPLLTASEVILVMEAKHQKSLEQQYPILKGKIFKLSHWSGGFDIPDPYRRPEAVFDQTLYLMEQCVPKWVQWLKNDDIIHQTPVGLTLF